MSETKVPVIRKDALVQLSVATGFIQRLQQLSVFMVSEKSEAEIDGFIKLLEGGNTEFDEPWMNNYYTVMLLLRAIDDAAIAQGFVEHLDEEQAAASLLDSSQLDQSLEQPE